MTGNKIAIDTEIALKLLADVPEVVAWLRGFDEVILPVPVIEELASSAGKSISPEKAVAAVELLTQRLPILNITPTTRFHCKAIRQDLMQNGKAIPENDLWIAAICLENQIPLATKDSHFSLISNLNVLPPG